MVRLARVDVFSWRCDILTLPYNFALAIPSMTKELPGQAACILPVLLLGRIPTWERGGEEKQIKVVGSSSKEEIEEK